MLTPRRSNLIRQYTTRHTKILTEYQKRIFGGYFTMTKFLAWGIIAMFLIVLVGTYFVFVAVAIVAPYAANW